MPTFIRFLWSELAVKSVVMLVLKVSLGLLYSTVCFAIIVVVVLIVVWEEIELSTTTLGQRSGLRAIDVL